MSQQFQFECQECGKCFLASRPNAQYCSNRCNQRAYRRRRKLLRESMRLNLSMDDVKAINDIKSISEYPENSQVVIDAIVRKYAGGLRTNMLEVLFLGVLLGRYGDSGKLPENVFRGDDRWTTAD